MLLRWEASQMRHISHSDSNLMGAVNTLTSDDPESNQTVDHISADGMPESSTYLH